MNDTCPVCKKFARHKLATGDGVLIFCDDHCGRYNISGTVIELWKQGTLDKPDPKRIRILIETKFGEEIRQRGKEYATYPWITLPDIERLVQ